MVLSRYRRTFPFMKYIFTILFCIVTLIAKTQSIELMIHEDGGFGDVQFLKPLSKDYKWTIFSRTRLNTDFKANNNLLSALYLNYTTKSGIGGTLLGAVGNNSTSSGAGIHLTKNTDSFSIFALPYVTFLEDPTLNWFSIARYRPQLSEKLRLYTSLELFSVFDLSHVISIQRIRLGLEMSSYQFGFGSNLSELAGTSEITGDYGIFIRKTFN